ncbi:hypothetical protein EYF80_042705 [Liparis tanakae]|uniref:Uncharacterized protein n=1 Tax=Liparis tanakae TaxID=230148 RepID=A0A4Z2G2H1_9TELE|nr:hypothetical protein EYF80_042705 [Liparis tanakae]
MEMSAGSRHSGALPVPIRSSHSQGRGHICVTMATLIRNPPIKSRWIVVGDGQLAHDSDDIVQKPRYSRRASVPVTGQNSTAIQSSDGNCDNKFDK